MRRMDTHHQSRAPLIIAIVLLVVPVLYMGSYLTLVAPIGRAVYPDPSLDDYFICHYRVDSEILLPTVFWPIEYVDRKLRPAAWGDVVPLRMR
jgi:hypothetical protein